MSAPFLVSKHLSGVGSRQCGTCRHGGSRTPTEDEDYRDEAPCRGSGVLPSRGPCVTVLGYWVRLTTVPSGYSIAGETRKNNTFLPTFLTSLIIPAEESTGSTAENPTDRASPCTSIMLEAMAIVRNEPLVVLGTNSGDN